MNDNQTPDGEIQAAIAEDEIVRRYGMFIALALSIPEAINIKPFEEVFKQAAKYAALRAYRPVDGSTSDGHHIFDELYHHRAILFSSVCYAYKDKAWRSKKHHDGTMFGDDWFIVGVETPAGQYSYHYRISKCWCLFNFCQTDDFAPEWDGHQPNDVDRLLSLKQYRKPEPWIPVSERLPQSYDHENGEPIEYLVMIKEATRPATLCFDGYEWFDMNWHIPERTESYAVTHWMPLPEPPNCGRKLQEKQ